MNKILTQMKFFLGMMLLVVALEGRAAFAQEESKPLFKTARLVAYPTSPQKISVMADILNTPTRKGHINGQYYEDGKYKDQAWVHHKKEMLDAGKINYAFFCSPRNLDSCICVVGMDHYSPSSDYNFFYMTHPDYQGRGYGKEAVMGFLQHVLVSLQPTASIVFSVHPSNVPSLKILGTIEAGLLREGMNFSGTQQRRFYGSAVENFFAQTREFPSISYIFGEDPLHETSLRIAKNTLKAQKIKADDVVSLGLTSRLERRDFYSISTKDLESRVPILNYRYVQFLPYHTFLYQLVRDVDQVFRSQNAKYWVLAGNLLGQQRHRFSEELPGGINPWDDDGDMAVLSSQRSIIERAMQDLKEIGYYITRVDEVWGTEWFKGWKVEAHKSSFFINGEERIPFVDIYELSKQGMTYEFPRTSDNAALVPKYSLHHSDLFPIMRGRFGNSYINIPANPEEILNISYGKLWKKEYKRWSHYFGIQDSDALTFDPSEKMVAAPDLLPLSSDQ